MTERDPNNGRFLKGNRFWEARSSHGAKPKFEKADDLWSACCEYFDWVDNNPLGGGGGRLASGASGKVIVTVIG